MSCLTRKAQNKVSSQFQMSLSDIILTIKNIGSNRDRLRPMQIHENFNQSLVELQLEGILECKAVIVSCMCWLLTTQTTQVDFINDADRQQALSSMLNLILKMYGSTRSISHAQELYEALRCAVRLFGLSGELTDNQIFQALNLLQVCALDSRKVSTLTFLKIVKEAMMARGPEQGQRSRDQRSREYKGVITYLGSQIKDLMLKSQLQDTLSDNLQLTHFEDLRTLAIEQLEQLGGDESNKDLLIDALVYLKEQMQEYQEGQLENMAHTGEMRAQETEESRLGLSNRVSGPQNELYTNPTEQSFTEQAQPQIPKDEQLLNLLDINFEQGLLLLKELVKEEQTGLIQLDFHQKEAIITSLLSKTTPGQRNQHDQYKQAYSLKALMWLKEEFIGLEECFKMTHLILDTLAGALLEDRDSSIEQYLLDFWVKDLSLRDLVDRIQFSARKAGQGHSQVFNALFSWLVNSKLIQQKTQVQNWVLEDFRKVALMLAQNVIESNSLKLESQEMSSKFIEMAVDKFGAKKFRDFMEIQLIQDNQTLIRFLDIFDARYDTHAKSSQLMTETADQELSHALFNHGNESKSSLLQEPLLTGRSGVASARGDRSQLLQEMRDKRKASNQQRAGADESQLISEEQEFQSTLAQEKKKYEEIMSRIDSKYRATEPEEGSQNVAIEGLTAVNRINTQSRGEQIKQEDRPSSNYNKRYQTQESRQLP